MGSDANVSNSTVPRRIEEQLRECEERIREINGQIDRERALQAKRQESLRAAQLELNDALAVLSRLGDYCREQEIIIGSLARKANRLERELTAKRAGGGHAQEITRLEAEYQNSTERLSKARERLEWVRKLRNDPDALRCLESKVQRERELVAQSAGELEMLGRSRVSLETEARRLETERNTASEQTRKRASTLALRAFLCVAAIVLVCVAGTLATGSLESCSHAGSTPVYRMYNQATGEHLFTASNSERNSLVDAGWTLENIGWYAPASSSTPVYRLYYGSAHGSDHHYTASEEERDMLVEAGWTYEGIGWYSDDSHTVPVYRLNNPQATTGTHNYTASAEERDLLVEAGWNDEGIGWYGV